MKYDPDNSKKLNQPVDLLNFSKFVILENNDGSMASKKRLDTFIWDIVRVRRSERLREFKLYNVGVIDQKLLLIELDY